MAPDPPVGRVHGWAPIPTLEPTIGQGSKARSQTHLHEKSEFRFLARINLPPFDRFTGENSPGSLQLQQLARIVAWVHHISPTNWPISARFGELATSSTTSFMLFPWPDPHFTKWHHPRSPAFQACGPCRSEPACNSPSWTLKNHGKSLIQTGKVPK